MTVAALGFLVASALQLAGLWVIWAVMRDLLRAVARGRIDRLLELRLGTVQRQRLLLGTGLFTGGIVATGLCGAAVALA